MTPSARVQAAIEVLDDILTGTAAEQALVRWTRAHRFAGSKDRAALRDLVFDALRCRDSFAALGGGLTGRGLQIGRCVASGIPPETVFDGQGYGPAPLSAADRAAMGPQAELPRAAALDMPGWLLSRLQEAYGPQAEGICRSLRSRAPLDLRVNTLKSDVDSARRSLAVEGVVCAPVPGVATALRVSEGARRVAQTAAYREGLVEVQDAASQACVLAVPVPPDGVILDYCAGGGGKALALAARTSARVHVHDIAPRRMQDIPARAARAGIALPVWQGGPPEAFDMVFCDAPCSGSGTWRRAPGAKWDLTEAALARLCDTQREVLALAAPLVRAGGVLVYATCSVLPEENSALVRWAVESFPEFTCVSQTQTLPEDPGDGFFHAVLRKRAAT